MKEKNLDGSGRPLTEPTGARAFPVVGMDGVWDPGMTLRDYFAAKAMLALIPEYSYADAALRAYKQADAMLAERSRREAQP